MSNSVRPHKRQPTRLLRPWDSPGKNTGVGCHFLLQCMKVKSESEVVQSCPTPRDPMDCSLPGSSVRGFSRQEYWSGVPLPSLPVSLGFSNLRQSFGFLFVCLFPSHDLDTSVEYYWVTLQIAPQFGFFQCILMVRLRLCIFGKNTTEVNSLQWRRLQQNSRVIKYWYI